MARNKGIEGLVSALVAVALLMFVFLSGLTFNFGFWSYLVLIFAAIIVYLLFLYVYSKSRVLRARTEFRGEGPIVEYKSPAMEEFDQEYKEAKMKGDVTKKLDVVEDGYVGTEESKMYHKNSCRFAKLIKPKYRIEADKEFFKKKKFKPCSVCKPNKK